jgi:alpha-mannosidase
MNTSWDEARFESCAHKWADVSEGGYGVSLMNDCKYGYSVINHNLSITLLKAGTEPNEKADIEKHFFTYSLFPHIGSWEEGGTENESFNLNVPVRAFKGGKAGETFSFMSVDKKNVVLETVKEAEDNSGVIVRLYEVENKRSHVTLTACGNIKSVVETDLMEKELCGSQVKADGRTFNFEIKPYEIKTFKVVM